MTTKAASKCVDEARGPADGGSAHVMYPLTPRDAEIWATWCQHELEVWMVHIVHDPARGSPLVHLFSFNSDIMMAAVAAAKYGTGRGFFEGGATVSVPIFGKVEEVRPTVRMSFQWTREPRLLCRGADIAALQEAGAIDVSQGGFPSLEAVAENQAVACTSGWPRATVVVALDRRMSEAARRILVGNVAACLVRKREIISAGTDVLVAAGSVGLCVAMFPEVAEAEGFFVIGRPTCTWRRGPGRGGRRVAVWEVLQAAGVEGDVPQEWWVEVRQVAVAQGESLVAAQQQELARLLRQQQQQEGRLTLLEGQWERRLRKDAAAPRDGEVVEYCGGDEGASVLHSGAGAEAGPLAEEDGEGVAVGAGGVADGDHEEDAAAPRDDSAEGQQRKEAEGCVQDVEDIFTILLACLFFIFVVVALPLLPVVIIVFFVLHRDLFADLVHPQRRREAIRKCIAAGGRGCLGQSADVDGKDKEYAAAM